MALKAEPLSPREVRERRLLPGEIKTRWGYPPSTERVALPMHVQWEYDAAEAATEESRAAGTLRQDYPQLWESPGPYEDLVSFDGLTVHDWQA